MYSQSIELASKKKEEDRLASRGRHLASDSGPRGTFGRKPEATQSNGMRTAHRLGMRPIYEFFFFFTDLFSCGRPYFFLGNLLTKLGNSRKRGRILRSDSVTSPSCGTEQHAPSTQGSLDGQRTWLREASLLCRERFASCACQVHDAACFTAQHFHA